MRSAVLADTGPRDDGFEQAREDVSRLNSERLSVAVPFPILCESYSMVLHRLGAKRAQAWLEEVGDRASLVNPSNQDYAAAADLIAEYPDQRLTLFDAVTAILSERLGLPVWTYDHHFDVMCVEVWRNGT